MCISWWCDFFIVRWWCWPWRTSFRFSTKIRTKDTISSRWTCNFGDRAIRFYFIEKPNILIITTTECTNFCIFKMLWWLLPKIYKKLFKSNGWKSSMKGFFNVRITRRYQCEMSYTFVYFPSFSSLIWAQSPKISINGEKKLIYPTYYQASSLAETISWIPCLIVSFRVQNNDEKSLWWRYIGA